jgi:hypothetical protein
MCIRWGPAQQASLKHEDEVVTINGEAVAGKAYKQVRKMVRGEPDTAVKPGVKGDGGAREIASTRIADEKLYKGEKESEAMGGRVYGTHFGSMFLLHAPHPMTDEKQIVAKDRIGIEYPSPVVDHIQARGKYLALGNS